MVVRTTLQNYLDDHACQAPFSSDQKNTIRQRIHSCTQSTHVSHLSSLPVWHKYRKFLPYIGITTLFAFFVFGGWINNHLPWLERDGFVVSNSLSTKTGPLAQASSLGSIVDVTGSYQIIGPNEQRFFTNMLFDGDRLQLTDGSSVRFAVRGHEAYIVGPASLEVYATDQGYRFVVLEGDFVEVFSERRDSGSILEIRQDSFALRHNAYERTLQVQLVKQNEVLYVNNYADPVDATIDNTPQSLDASSQLAVHDNGSDVFMLEELVYTADVGDEVQDVSLLTLGSIDSVASGVSDVSMATAMTSGTSSLAVVNELRMLPTSSQLDSLALLDSINRGNAYVLSGNSVVANNAHAYARSKFVAVWGCGLELSDAHECMTLMTETYELPPSFVSSLGIVIDSINNSYKQLTDVTTASSASPQDAIMINDVGVDEPGNSINVD